MPQKNLKDYVKDKLGKGYSTFTIKKALLKWGYKEENVDMVFSSLLPLGKQKAAEEHHKGQFSLFVRPGSFFSERSDLGIHKAVRYFLHAFLIFFAIQFLITLLAGIFARGEGYFIPAALLANVLTSLLFLLSILIFSSLLAGLCFFSSKYIFQERMDFLLILTILLFALVPYVLISSLRSLEVYGIISLLGVSIGVLDINIFFLWSLFLFSLGMSKSLGLSVKKGVLFVLVPFAFLMAALAFASYGALRARFLWLVFERF